MHKTKSKFDAILVLGTSTQKKLFKKRVETAVYLYKQGVANRIIFSGKWWGGLKIKPSKTEAFYMADYAKSLGASRNDIYLEEKSLNTIGNFYFTKKNILLPNKIRKLLVITHTEHFKKARYLARKVLGNNYNWKMVTDTRETVLGVSHRDMSDIRHFFVKIKDGDDEAIALLIKNHPYYRGYRNI